MKIKSGKFIEIMWKYIDYIGLVKNYVVLNCSSLLTRDWIVVHFWHASVLLKSPILLNSIIYCSFFYFISLIYFILFISRFYSSVRFVSFLLLNWFRFFSFRFFSFLSVSHFTGTPFRYFFRYNHFSHKVFKLKGFYQCQRSWNRHIL